MEELGPPAMEKSDHESTKHRNKCKDGRIRPVFYFLGFCTLLVLLWSLCSGTPLSPFRYLPYLIPRFIIGFKSSFAQADSFLWKNVSFPHLFLRADGWLLIHSSSRLNPRITSTGSIAMTLSSALDCKSHWITPGLMERKLR
jgi:hypothetical protein